MECPECGNQHIVRFGRCCTFVRDRCVYFNIKSIYHNDIMEDIQPTEQNLNKFREVYNHFDQIKINEKTYFLASSALRKLRYTNIYRKMLDLDIVNYNNKKYMSEGDLNMLIMNARDKNVKEFSHWIIKCILTKGESDFNCKKFGEYLDVCV